MSISAVVLGTAQDGGWPQAGCTRSCCRQVGSPRTPACLGLNDGDKAILIDATPALPDQLLRWGRSPDAVLLTHIHMGHWPGLMHFGREAMNARDLPLFAAQENFDLLQSGEPIRTLIQNHFRPSSLQDREPVQISRNLTITPHQVEHRQDNNPVTFAFEIEGPNRSILWCPDVDRWNNEWLLETVGRVDMAFLDGCFVDPLVEIGRSDVPHPPMPQSIEILGDLMQKVKFIHLNHTNPALEPGHALHSLIAHEGEQFSF